MLKKLNKKNTFLSLSLTLLLVSCSSDDSNKTTSTNANTQGIKTSSIDYYVTPEKNSFLENEKKNKNLSEISLGITKDGYSGYDYKSSPIYRKVEIPENYNQGNYILQGSILDNIKDARVCLDINNNNLCDNQEPLALSKDDSTFELRLEDKYKDKNDLNIIALRGTNQDSSRGMISILKTKNKQNATLSSFSTLLNVSNAINEMEVKNTFKLKDDDELDTYKKSFLLQKVIDIVTSSFDLKEDKQIINKTLEIYKQIAASLSTNLSSTIDGINDVNIAKTKRDLKELISEVNTIKLNKNNKEAFAVVLNARLNDAKKHFKTSSDELVLEPIVESKLQKEAIKIRLEEIGVENINTQMVDDVIASNLKIKDLENLDKIKEKPNLSALKKQLEKKENAISNIVILKALLRGNFLEIYFSERLSDESITRLKEVNNINKIYDISGLEFNIINSSWDDKSFKNILEFETIPIRKGTKRELFIKYLALKDKYGKYTRAKPEIRSIESARKIPQTGQKKVWAKYDDGSLNYGFKVNFKKETTTTGDVVINSTDANLQWQDVAYKDGLNDNINHASAVKYCEGLNYAGFDDWRLPNVKELVSTTSINIQEKGIFENYSESSISFSGSNQSAFLGERVVGVGKYGKTATVIHKDEKYSVRCVRNIDKKKDSLFPDNAFDNIIMYKEDKLSYDPSTNIMYLDEPFTTEEKKAKEISMKENSKEVPNIGKFGDLEHALQYCNKLNDGTGYEGFKNWRLANVNDMFFSLNSKGSRTFQNRIEGFDYTLTSSSSYKDGTKYPWMVGNFFTRVLAHNRTKGFFRCVRNMNENELKTAKNKDTSSKNRKRKYVLKNNTIDINLPKNIFDKFEGIKLTKYDSNKILNDKLYEISNLLPKSVPIENYTIKSITLDGNQICTTNTFEDSKKLLEFTFPHTLCMEDGLFRIYLQSYLTTNRYGISKLQIGKIYKIIMNNGENDFNINLKILDNNSTDTNDEGSSPTEESDNTSAIKLIEPTKTIEVSASSSYRLDNRAYILSTADKIGIYNFIKEQDIDKIKGLKIVSGNEDGIFMAYSDTIGNHDIKIDTNKISTLVAGKKYTLQIQAIGKDEKVTNTITIKIDIVSPSIKAKNVVISIEDADTDNKLKNTNEPILFTLWKNKSYYNYRLKVIENTDAKEDEIIYELEENSTFKLLRFNIDYGNYYAIVLKDGKTPGAKEVLNLKAKVSYVKSGVIQTEQSPFTITITNPNSKTYEQIKELNRNAKSLEILKEKPKVIEEKFPAVLQDYTYDDKYKTYPSSKALLFKKIDLIKKEATTKGDIEYKIVSGNDYGYFKKFLIDNYGYVNITLNNNKNIPTGEYSLEVNISQGGKTSNTAKINFNIYEVEAPSVIETPIKLNLVDKNSKNDDYYAEKANTTKVTPLFIFAFSKSEYFPERFGILKRDEKKNNLLNGNINLKYKLISDTSNSYEIKEFYYENEKKYGIFLKEGKTGNIVSTLKIQLIGVDHRNLEHTNPKNATINIIFEVIPFSLKPQNISVSKTSMKEYWKDKHKYFILATEEPGSWSSRYTIFPFTNVGSYKNPDSIKYEIVGISNNYKIEKIVTKYSTSWELQLKDGVEKAVAETLKIKVTGLLNNSHIGTFTLKITD